ncbi:hypothetical protein AGR4A_pAt10358 [Agrobacterium tumefaciens str. B6]|uniref:Uncharacterized protein n=1 Tax=Agrobacterium tumefaciens str. B6 TaxID=1183423 RepID=A0A822V9P1_AGRTU|nr:hypothetical protein AGR4A_pAt10020 [Agrobacterium tumefaciens str. B6]CVI24904.1 hypothetical protein AGR4A_pAt10358 [Agrobacterium tumefaciens str. B6]
MRRQNNAQFASIADAVDEVTPRGAEGQLSVTSTRAT